MLVFLQYFQHTLDYISYNRTHGHLQVFWQRRKTANTSDFYQLTLTH